MEVQGDAIGLEALGAGAANTRALIVRTGFLTRGPLKGSERVSIGYRVYRA